MKYKALKSTGFSLVETLVAISILTTVITGAYAAAQSGISSASASKNQAIAFNLAQEGVEQIGNMRDENALTIDGDGIQRHWLYGISSNGSDPCAFGKVCMADILNSTLSECPSSCPLIKQDPTSGFYGYNSSWPDTNFRREIRLSQVSDTEITVEVKITWTRGILNNEFTATENILNWQ